MQASTRRYANPYEVQVVRWLIDAGLNNCQISRATGISVPAVREWRHRPLEWPRVRRVDGKVGGPGALCPRCHDRPLDAKAYVYLLGQYLGDGYIVLMHRGVYKLQITMTAVYTKMIRECIDAVATVRGSACRPNIQQSVGCVNVYAYWKHWPCVFPQHSEGRKHRRRILLEPWQEEMVSRNPHLLLRGLIHSDGWRGTNPITRRYKTKAGQVTRRYEYPRYMFTNYSEDIRRIFARACDLYGVRCRKMRWNTLSVARREDVDKLDLVVGPKF